MGCCTATATSTERPEAQHNYSLHGSEQGGPHHAWNTLARAHERQCGPARLRAAAAAASGRRGLPEHPCVRASAHAQYVPGPGASLGAMFQRLLVPKPQLGLDFLTDSACVPNEFTTLDVTGPGDHSPYAPFSCSLEMKIFLAASRLDVPILGDGSVFLLLSVCLPMALLFTVYAPTPGWSLGPSLPEKRAALPCRHAGMVGYLESTILPMPPPTPYVQGPGESLPPYVFISSSSSHTLDCWSRVADPNTARGEVARLDSTMGPIPPSCTYVPGPG
mmetsp:Transcript_25465/g.64633  ORF Transcript_25465/g.64633 Transcript_25465/m.64633 type:complete len:276 (-) Transcript_25465:447-1274(-)